MRNEDGAAPDPVRPSWPNWRPDNTAVEWRGQSYGASTLPSEALPLRNGTPPSDQKGHVHSNRLFGDALASRGSWFFARVGVLTMRQGQWLSTPPTFDERD
jgi:hypothetical protein